MKKLISLLFTAFISFSLYAQTTVAEKKLGKTLEKNIDAAAVFVSEIDLSKMQIAESGTVTIPLLAKSKIKIVSGMDMTGISSRLTYSNLKKWNTTFEVKDLDSKIYAITNIAGIETVAQYKARYLEEQKAEARKNLTKYPVQVVNQEVINLGASETAWLPGQIQDKLKSNLQEYLGLKTVVDSKSEAALKKLQAESESAARDESTAIELGKITTAKFAVFTKVRKTESGYTISVDFTDLTTGEQMASATSKEYSKAEYLYGSTGAVDELTLSIANKLGLNISDLNKNLLTSGSANFSLDDQLALAKQNEEQFQKQMADYDAELSKLMTSNDIKAIQNKNRIEAEKALLVEKQNAERKRQEELGAQKLRADAAAKAAEVRKLKMEKQGVLGQISVIESKKKALVEIRQSVEERSKELYEQLVKDRDAEEARIRNKSYTTVELGSDGNPTEQAKLRRENQVIKSYQDLTNKFFTDCESVKQSTMAQDNALAAEINSDQKKLTAIRTVSSLGDELKVSYGKYEGSMNAWLAKLSLYSDGILIYEGGFWVTYELLTGKKAPDMKTELNDAVIEEYTQNVDMYTSLLARGEPIIYFELDYNVTAESNDKPSVYNFNFLKARIISTINGNIVGRYDKINNNVVTRTMKPQWDLREIEGIVHDEWIRQIDERKKTDYENEIIYSFCKGSVTLGSIPIAETKVFEYMTEKISKHFTMKQVTGRKFKIMTTEVTQKLYTSVMGSNPSYYKGDNNPVEQVSWYDAIYFCNKLSKICGLVPVYAVDGKTDVTKWNYTPHKGESISGEITQNTNANGIRLPTEEEWKYAASGGQNYKYSGSNNLDEVGWYDRNSGGRTHPVAQKKANGYGLYDMNGNVFEWCWDVNPKHINYNRYACGGCYDISASGCEFSCCLSSSGSNQSNDMGFRVVCSASN